MHGATQTETALLRRVLVKRPEEAFRDPGTIEAEWHRLGYPSPPDLGRARAEHARFRELLASHGAEVVVAPEEGGVTLDSIYVRDAAIVCARGAILCRMGKAERRGEPAALAAVFEAHGVPVLGAIEAPGTVEGGDVAWLDERTLAVGRGYRTNDEGARQLAERLGPEVEVVQVPLPHWRGAEDVFHLMSFLSPLDRDLLLVYSPLIPVPFRELLLERGFRLVEVPEDEFMGLGCNVLALGPRKALAVTGYPRTRARMEAAGVEVLTFEGEEIAGKGAGGPTCLTRPLERIER